MRTEALLEQEASQAEGRITDLQGNILFFKTVFLSFTTFFSSEIVAKEFWQLLDST